VLGCSQVVARTLDPRTSPWHAHAGRECVCPEVNRNSNIGEKGANMDSRIFRRYLSTMMWNKEMVRGS
jgi:hypothetical protein